jgi:AraC family transcriptional regulator
VPTIVLDQPDLTRPGKSRRRAFGSGEDRILVLNGRSLEFEGGAEAPELSLKCMLAGVADYRASGRDFRLSGTSHLLLNRGEPYRLKFRGEGESFAVFFPARLADQAWGALAPGMERLAEFPTIAARSPPSLQLALETLIGMTKRANPEGRALEESSLALLTEIASLARLRRGHSDRVPALRGTTRAELLRRIARAEEHLLDDHRATLTSAAAAAALSPFHLIRVFRAVHGMTPLRFAQAKRLDIARDTLLLSNDSIENIAHRAGYESRNAFDRAFHRRHGATPGAIRSGR